MVAAAHRFSGSLATPRYQNNASPRNLRTYIQAVASLETPMGSRSAKHELEYNLCTKNGAVGSLHLGCSSALGGTRAITVAAEINITFGKRLGDCELSRVLSFQLHLPGSVLEKPRRRLFKHGDWTAAHCNLLAAKTQSAPWKRHRSACQPYLVPLKTNFRTPKKHLKFLQSSHSELEL